MNNLRGVIESIESGDATVSVCGSDGGFVLTVGASSVCFDRSAAEDVVAVLACALANEPRAARPIAGAALRKILKQRPFQ